MDYLGSNERCSDYVVIIHPLLLESTKDIIRNLARELAYKDVFDFNKKTSITVKDKSIKFVLDMIFNNQLDYEVMDKKVILKKKVKVNVVSEVEDEIVQRNGVTILGKKNILNKLPVSASNLYAKNLFNFVLNLYDKKNNKININLEDEIINKTLIK